MNSISSTQTESRPAGRAILQDPRAPIAAMLLMALAFALILPPYYGPDETGHVAYIAALSEGRLPTLPFSEVAVADIKTGTSWQGQHPPLYHLLATPFYLLAGRDPTVGLYLCRLLGIAALAVVLILFRRLAMLLLPPERVGTAVWFLALHPTVVYVASMANNEPMAMAFAVGCVWAAVKSRQAPEEDAPARRKWLLLAILMGGLGLLTKLTAIAGVAAAAFIVGQGRAERANWLNGLGVLAGAVGIWLPWGLAMQQMHGSFVPNPVLRPAFTGGLWALTVFPVEILSVAGLAMAEYAIGLLCPFWLIAPFTFTHYPMVAAGWLLALGVLYLSVTRKDLRFVAVGFIVLYLLITSQVLFRDMGAILFLARYSVMTTVFVSLLVAHAYDRLSPLVRQALAVLWGAVIVANVIYIYYFFLVGIPPLKQ